VKGILPAGSEVNKRKTGKKLDGVVPGTPRGRPVFINSRKLWLCVKKIVIGLSVLAALAAIFILAVWLPGEEGMRRWFAFPEPEEVVSNGEEDPPDPEVIPEHELLAEQLRYALELEELQQTTPPAGKEDWLTLAGREDAVGYQARLFLARHFQDEEDVEPAVYYRRALDLHETREVREELGAYLRQTGADAEAREVYRQLLPAEAAREALLDLGTAPESIAADLVEGNYWVTLTAFYASLPEEDRTERLERYYLMGLVQTGRHQEALEPLEAWVEEALFDPELDPELTWHYARALERSGRPGEALPYYAAAGERGHFRRGVILENQGNLAGAAEAFSAAPEAEARWRGARLWERLGETGEALGVYTELAAEASAVQDDAAFRAYVLLAGDEDERAREFLDLLAPSAAWMERLGREPRRELHEEAVLEIPEYLERIEAYQQTNRRELAALELAIRGARATAAERLALAHWHREGGNYFRAVREGIRALNERPCLQAYRLAYLRPYMEYVERAARDFQLDPYLILAVMREESHYRADVISHADARGLMQIMPATGEYIASRKNMDFTLGMLFDPETNIRFGAWYLRSMLNSFDEDLDRALAAYNAGPGNARRWSETPLGQEPLGFPTAITFIETREYITKVRDSYLTYRWLYEE